MALFDPMKIGRIKKVPLREIWQHEAHDFSKWLSAHIGHLNEALETTITIEEREKAVGSFSLDLFGDDGEGGKVIIENQLEKTDHDHLGKVLTYLSNLDDVKCAIWITSMPREEHGRAIDWLNEFTPDDIAFYLVKLEAIRIGEHPVVAPHFSVVNGPSEQMKKLGQARKDEAARKKKNREFWTQFLQQMQGKSEMYVNQKPPANAWMSHGMGISGSNFNVYCTRKYVRGEVYLSKGTAEENKRIFDYYHDRREEIESAFGPGLVWERLDDGIHSRIKHQLDGIGWDNREDWPRIIDFLVDSALRLERAFGHHAAHLKSEW